MKRIVQMKKIILIGLAIGVMMFGAVGLMSKANAATISLPNDFSEIQGTNNIYYEAYPDNRPTNTTNPNSNSPYLLAYVGIGVIGHNGPTYVDAGWWFPFIVFETDSNTLLLHPGTGGYDYGSGSSDIGVSIQFSAPQSNYYHISGDFARANINQNAGNGVDVLIFRGTDPGNALFSASIDATHSVDTNDYFGGTGVAHFDFGVNLAQNEVLRFAVFCDAQGQDGTFDVTALRVSIVPIPSPIFLLGSSLMGFVALRRLRKG